MRDRMIFALGLVLFLGSVDGLRGQAVQLLYTKSVLKDSMAYKKALKVDKLEALFAAALMNMSAVRKEAYLKKIAATDAVLIIGEGALKAAGKIDFPMAVIIVNGRGETAARGAVFRLADGDFDLGGRKAVSVSDPAQFSLSAASLNGGHETTIKCEGIPCSSIADKLVAEITRKR